MKVRDEAVEGSWLRGLFGRREQPDTEPADAGADERVDAPVADEPAETVRLGVAG